MQKERALENEEPNWAKVEEEKEEVVEEWVEKEEGVLLCVVWEEV